MGRMSSAHAMLDGRARDLPLAGHCTDGNSASYDDSSSCTDVFRLNKMRTKPPLITALSLRRRPQHQAAPPQKQSPLQPYLQPGTAQTAIRKSHRSEDAEQGESLKGRQRQSTASHRPISGQHSSSPGKPPNAEMQDARITPSARAAPLIQSPVYCPTAEAPGVLPLSQLQADRPLGSHLPSRSFISYWGPTLGERMNPQGKSKEGKQ